MRPRIFVAFLVGGGLIALGYFYAPIATPQVNTDPTVSVVSGPAPTRAPITVSDSDFDGIPDWREEFRNTKPFEVTTPTESQETYTPPDTLTGQLAIDLLSGTVESKIRGPFGSSQEELLQNAASAIETAATDNFYTEDDIHLSDNNSAQAIRTYGNLIARIALYNGVPVGTRSEMEVVDHAIRGNDPSVLTELDPRITAYEEMVRDMLLTSVPSTMRTEHLNLLNAYSALLEDLKGMRGAFDDPLYAMVRMKRYYDDALGINNAIASLYNATYDDGVRFSEGDLALNLVKLESE